MNNGVAFLKVCVLAAALLALSAGDAAARTIRLAWDASADTTATGYRVYWSTEAGVYNDTDYVDVGNRLEWTGDLPGDQYYLAVRAYDEEGHLGPLSLEVGDTAAFWLSNPGDQSSETGQAVVLPLVAYGAAVTYGADGLPDGLGVDAINGQVFGTVTTSVVSPTASTVTARAVNALGHVSSVQFYWTISTLQPPMVPNPGDQSNVHGDVVVLPIGAVDPDGGTLQYSAGNLPTGLQIDATTGIISGTISPAAAGVFDVSVSVSDGRLVTTVRFAWQILTDDRLTVDRVVSADAMGSTVTTLTTPPFSTALAGETLIAFVESAHPASEGTVVSGAGLQWSLGIRANALPGTVEIWSARAPARLSNVTVTADVTVGDTFLSLTVVSFAGADGVGASAAASGAGAPAVSLSTTRAGSFVFGAGNDWDGMVSRTIPAGQEIVHEALGELGDTFWVQRLTGAIAAAGTPVTVNAIEPSDHRFNIAAVEVLARSRGVPTVVPTVVLTPEVALPGSSLSAAISDGPGNRADWAGLFRVTAHSTDLVAWQYLNGKRTLPRTGVTSALLSFAAPAQPGMYLVRLFAETDRQTPIAVSNAILVPSCLSIDGKSMREGSAGSSSMVFTVMLSPASAAPVTVNYATADGTAKAGSDYVARSGTLVFAPGTTKQTIVVTIDGDTTFESDESFSLMLSGATNAVIGDTNALGTIVNDDAPPVENQMFGFGAIDEGRLRQRFVFRVSERNARNYSRLEFWSSEPIKGRDVDDDDRDGGFDTDYGRDHRKARNRFESTVISSVTFGPRDKNGGSVTFSGEGVWNDKSGFTFEARAMDRGEPGRGRDTFMLIVKDKHGTVVLNASGTLDQGNIQLTQSRER
jgi:hypothetical protein